jgi:hypothetical protein
MPAFVGSVKIMSEERYVELGCRAGADLLQPIIVDPQDDELPRYSLPSHL